MKNNKSMFNEKERKIIYRLAERIAPPGEKYQLSGSDDAGLIHRLEDFVGGLDSLSIRAFKAGLYHINYMNMVNIIICILAYFLCYVILANTGLGWPLWVLGFAVVTYVLVRLDLFTSFHFGIVPFHQMDGETADAFLEKLEKSPFAPTRWAFFGLKGVISLACYSSPEYEKFIGYHDYYQVCIKKALNKS